MYSLVKILQKQNISKNTLLAMKKVDRQLYIPTKLKGQAYQNKALPIGYNVTISQPSLVGYMIDQLQLDTINNVLELGTGSGYNAAIISHLLPYGNLTTVERVKPLGDKAKKMFKDKKHIKVIVGDATKIKYEHKFDRIIVTAEFLDKIQLSKFIKDNAAIFSIIIYPFNDWLWKVVKCGDKYTVEKLIRVKFVPVL